MNNAVAEMDKVVQQNASDAEESSCAARELESIVLRIHAFVHGEGRAESGGAKQA